MQCEPHQHLDQRQDVRNEELMVTMVHEEVELVAGVPPQVLHFLWLLQGPPFRQEAEVFPEGRLFTTAQSSHAASLPCTSSWS